MKNIEYEKTRFIWYRICGRTRQIYAPTSLYNRESNQNRTFKLLLHTLKTTIKDDRVTYIKCLNCHERYHNTNAVKGILRYTQARDRSL